MKKIFNQLDTIGKLTGLLGPLSIVIFCTDKWFIEICVSELLEITFQLYVLISILVLNNNSRKS